MVYETAMRYRSRSRGFRTLPGFLLFVIGILLLALGGFARDKKFKDTAAEKHTLSDYVLAVIGIGCIIGAMVFEVKGY